MVHVFPCCRPSIEEWADRLAEDSVNAGEVEYGTTDRELDRRCAVLCGWENVRQHDMGEWLPAPGLQWVGNPPHSPSVHASHGSMIPNYTADWNACWNEVRPVLVERRLWDQFELELSTALSTRGPWELATPADFARAAVAVLETADD